MAFCHVLEGFSSQPLLMVKQAYLLLLPDAEWLDGRQHLLPRDQEIALTIHLPETHCRFAEHYERQNERVKSRKLHTAYPSTRVYFARAVSFLVRRYPIFEGARPLLLLFVIVHILSSLSLGIT